MNADPRRSPLTWPLPSWALLAGSIAILAASPTGAGFEALALACCCVLWALHSRDWRSPAWLVWAAALLADPVHALALMLAAVVGEWVLLLYLRGRLKLRR